MILLLVAVGFLVDAHDSRRDLQGLASLQDRLLVCSHESIPPITLRMAC